MSYTPSKKILDKYADVLVKCALNGGSGIKKGEVVLLQVHECAKPMLFALRNAVLRAGGHTITHFFPDGDSRYSYAREFYDIASEEQLKFFPEKLLKGRIEQIDHSIYILSDYKKYELKGIEPKKILATQTAFFPYRKWSEEKENKGKYTWVIALYGTPAMAKDVGLTEKEYWGEIIKACYLNEKNPTNKWKSIMSSIHLLKKKLNALKIKKLHIVSKGTDLWVGIGKNRKWLGGRGRNIPSFEVFISPDFRETQGHISFNKPLYHYGNRIDGIKLWFKNGHIIKATAKKNAKLLKEMIAQKGANMVGEYSLTDARMSKITKFMGTTLFDENVGGREGNTHIAIGNAYKDSYIGDPSKVPSAKWKKMGFNESPIHTDIISTERRIVTAVLPNGRERVIYKNGMFLL